MKEECPGVDCYAVDTIEEAVKDADIVSVYTSSPTGDPDLYPYIAESWINREQLLKQRPHYALMMILLSTGQGQPRTILSYMRHGKRNMHRKHTTPYRFRPFMWKI